MILSMLLAATLAAAPSVRVSDFGYDKADSTRFLQAALDSGAATVVVDRVGDGVWTTGPLVLTNATLKRLVFEPGVTLQAKRGDFRARNDILLRLRYVNGLTVTGRGARLKMWRDDYVRPPYAKSEHRHCLELRNCDNVTVEGLRFEESGGDGVYICNGRGRDGKIVPCRNITLRGLVCDRNYRQGLSVIGADGLLVEDCTFSNTKGTPPQSGVDLEPNHPNEMLRGIVFRKVKAFGNQGCGIEFYLGAMDSSSEPVTAVFENCELSDNTYDFKYSCSRVRHDDLPKGGSVAFRNCRFDTARRTAILIQEKPATGAAMSFEACTVEGWTAHPLVTNVEAWDDPPVDGVTFRNVRARQTPQDEWRLLDREFRPTGCPGFDDGRTPARRTADYAAYRVTDRRPGEMIRFPGAGLTTQSKLVVFAASAGTVRLAIGQVAVNGRRPPWRDGLRLVCLSDPSRPVRALKTPAPEATELAFDVPARGFYRLLFDAVKGEVRLTGANVPVAIDVTAAFQKLHGSAELYAVRRPDGPSAAIFWGETGARVTDAATGAELWSSGHVGDWTRALAEPGEGLLGITGSRPDRGDGGYWKVDLSGCNGFLFPTKERTWR